MGPPPHCAGTRQGGVQGEPYPQGKDGRAGGGKLLLLRYLHLLPVRSGVMGAQHRVQAPSVDLFCGSNTPTQTAVSLRRSRDAGSEPKAARKPGKWQVRWAPGGDTFEVAAARCSLVTLVTRLQKGHGGLGASVSVPTLFEAWGPVHPQPPAPVEGAPPVPPTERPQPRLDVTGAAGAGAARHPHGRGCTHRWGSRGTGFQIQVRPSSPARRLRCRAVSIPAPTPVLPHCPILCKGSAGVIPTWPWACVFIATVPYIYLRLHVRFLVI